MPASLGPTMLPTWRLLASAAQAGAPRALGRPAAWAGARPLKLWRQCRPPQRRLRQLKLQSVRPAGAHRPRRSGRAADRRKHGIMRRRKHRREPCPAQCSAGAHGSQRAGRPGRGCAPRRPGEGGRGPAPHGSPVGQHSGACAPGSVRWRQRGGPPPRWVSTLQRRKLIGSRTWRRNPRTRTTRRPRRRSGGPSRRAAPCGGAGGRAVAAAAARRPRRARQARQCSGGATWHHLAAGPGCCGEPAASVPRPRAGGGGKRPRRCGGHVHAGRRRRRLTSGRRGKNLLLPRQGKLPQQKEKR